jgi:hypothetical protein
MSWYNRYYHLQCAIFCNQALEDLAKYVQRWSIPNDFSNLWTYVAESLCLLDFWFPPAFFDLMIHLLNHLIDEMEICRLVGARWCYPVEKYLNVLKRYVRSMAWPKAMRHKGFAQSILHYIHIFNVECGIPIRRKRTIVRSLEGKPSSRSRTWWNSKEFMNMSS